MSSGMSVISTGTKGMSNPGPILASDSYYNSNTAYKEKLDIDHVDVPANDESVMGQLVRGVTGLVGGLFSPKRLIVVFRLLKALTFCCLCLTIAAEMIYLFFVELQVSSDVLKKLGGTRDEVLRVYGIGLALLAIFIELDMTVVDTHYPFMKGFLARSLLLMFVTTISGTTPIIGYENRLFSKYQNSNSYDDDGYVSEYLYNTEDSALIANEVPGSAVAFQATTTFFLFIIACVYFLMGLLCLDRFTSDAFLSNEDPASGTAISSAKGYGDNARNMSINDDGDGSFDIEYNRHDKVKSGMHSYSEDSCDVR